MLKRRVRILALAGAFSLVAVPALATYPVFDSTSFGKLIEQVNALQKQFEELVKQTEFLGEISKTAQDQINAIGKLGNVTLPLVNMAKLGQQISKDATCLLPDFSKLMPGINLDDLDWQSICARRVFYDTTLWFDPNDPDSWTFGEGGGPEDWSNPDGGVWGTGNGSGDWKNPDDPAEQRLYFAARAAALQATKERRSKLAQEAIATGLSQSDRMAGEQTELNQKLLEELEAEADAALDLKELLRALIGLVQHQSQMEVQTQQQMAQLIRIQSSMLLEFRPATEGPVEADEGGGE